MEFNSSTGALGGAALGTAIMPGPGTLIGAGVGGVAGGMFDSFQKGSEAEKNKPALDDPRQLARLREIDATRRQISEGRDPLTMQRVSEIQKMGETTKGQLGKFTGGDVGATLSSMLRAQRNIGQGLNQAYSESQNRLPFFENLSSQLLNRIEQRKFDLQKYDFLNSMKEKETADAETKGAISGLIGTMGGGQMSGIPGMSSVMGNMGGGGVNSVGQSSPGLATLPINLPQTFQQGLGGGGQGGFGQQLGGGFGGFGGGNSMIGSSPVAVDDYSNYVNG